MPWGFYFFTLYMEGSCQLAAEKIAYSANESKSNRDLFQIVSIHFSGLLIAVILEGCQKEKHKGKAPFRGRFLSARIDSEAALFPEFHLQEFLKSFPKLHLELGPGQLLQSLFPCSEDRTEMLYQPPQTD